MVTQGRLKSIMQDTVNSAANIRQPSILTNNTDPFWANELLPETYLLMQRTCMNVIRTPELFAARAGLCIFFGIIMGTLFLDSGDDTTGISNRIGYLIFALAFFYFTSLEAIPIFLSEREIFQREFSRGAYRAISFVIANSLVYLPFMVLMSLLFSSVSWFLIGMGTNAGVFFFMVLALFSVLAVANAFVILISAIVPDPLAGNSMGSAIFANMFLFCGFFIRKPSIPKWWM
jgi:ATP-binding cassette subfamily G (WHITE) protein 2